MLCELGKGTVEEQDFLTPSPHRPELQEPSSDPSTSASIHPVSQPPPQQHVRGTWPLLEHFRWQELTTAKAVCSNFRYLKLLLEVSEPKIRQSRRIPLLDYRDKLHLPFLSAVTMYPLFPTQVIPFWARYFTAFNPPS